MSHREITDVAFAREKYGSELLVDVCPTSSLEGFIVDDTPHRLGGRTPRADSTWR